MAATRPTPAEQYAAMKALESEGADSVDQAEAGDAWWVISLTWFNTWKLHVDWTNAGVAAGDQAPPRRISNANILDPNGGRKTQRLRTGLAMEADYTVLPDVMYQLLVEWYGVEPAEAPGLKRFVTAVGEKSVEVSVPVFDLLIASEEQPGGNPDSPAEVYFSKAQRLDGMPDSVVQQLVGNGVVKADEVPDLSNVRLWFSLGKGKKWHLLPMDDPVIDTVMGLAPPDSDVSVCRVPAPRLLVDVRTDAESAWVREGLDEFEDLSAKEAK